MAAPVRTTQLAAVNRILACIAEQPVASLTPPLPADATAIVAILDEVNLETQSRGWHFNSDEQVTLTPSSGKIDVAANWARVSVSRAQYPNMDVTGRDDSGTFRLYDKVNKTFVFNAPIKADIVYLFDFEATPEAFRRYVEVKAARTFLDRAQGDVPHHQYTKDDEIRALAYLQEHESVVDNPNVFDSYDAWRVVARQYPRIGWGS